MPTYHVRTHRQQTKARPHNDRAWRKASEAWLKQYPFCVLCLCRGHMNEGADVMGVTTQRNLVVDHIEPHRGNMDLFWDQDNWETLCRCPCHDIEKQQHEQRGGTAEQWYAMLRDEMRKHMVGDAIRHMLPEHMQMRMYPDAAGPGRGGVHAKAYEA